MALAAARGDAAWFSDAIRECAMHTNGTRGIRVQDGRDIELRRSSLDRIEGAFDAMDTARRARQLLLDAGVPSGDLSLSAPVTADPIAAEAPGESFENQPGQPDDGGPAEALEHAMSRHDEDVRAAVCVLSVETDASVESGALADVIRRAGARSVWRTGDGVTRQLF